MFAKILIISIGLINTCLEVCERRGGECLAITLVNERGGRQRCFAHDSSAAVDGTDPTASTGVFYFEKICVRKFHKEFYFVLRSVQFPILNQTFWTVNWRFLINFGTFR